MNLAFTDADDVLLKVNYASSRNVGNISHRAGVFWFLFLFFLVTKK